MLQMPKLMFFSVVGCRSNNECAEKQACIAKECRNPCDDKACLRSEVCEVVQHSARCITGKCIMAQCLKKIPKVSFFGM